MIQAILKNTDFKRMLCVAAAILIIICSMIAALKSTRANDNAAEALPRSQMSDEQSTKPTLPKIDKNQWNLILVNQWNYLPENYNPEIKYLDNGHAIDERAYSDLQNMMNDCRDAGLNPLICSSYRTMEKQEMLFNNKINEYLGYGYSRSEAERKAGELVAIPGTSEHQLGLALDIVDVSYQLLDENQENTDVQKWLIHNSWKYGFILRYPTDKSSITGISYEPWHYRYVGKEAAKEIYEAQICLEEYLNS